MLQNTSQNATRRGIRAKIIMSNGLADVATLKTCQAHLAALHMMVGGKRSGPRTSAIVKVVRTDEKLIMHLSQLGTEAGTGPVGQEAVEWLPDVDIAQDLR